MRGDVSGHTLVSVGECSVEECSVWSTCQSVLYITSAVYVTVNTQIYKCRQAHNTT